MRMGAPKNRREYRGVARLFLGDYVVAEGAWPANDFKRLLPLIFERAGTGRVSPS